MKIVKLLLGVWVGLCFGACDKKSDFFTGEERERIGHSEEAGIMPLFLVTDRADSLFLRFYRQRNSGKKISRRKLFVFNGHVCLLP